eukprot:scaffold5058_cov187-Alexandrium_tamarense.AAC.2
MEGRIIGINSHPQKPAKAGLLLHPVEDSLHPSWLSNKECKRLVEVLRTMRSNIPFSVEGVACLDEKVGWSGTQCTVRSNM